MSNKLKKLLEEIKTGKRKYIFDIKLTVEDLLTKDESGVYFVEHLLKNKISLYSMMDKIKNNIEIACIFCQNDESLYSFEFDEKTLFSDVNGITFLEYVLEQGKLTSQMVGAIKNRKEIIDILISYNKEYMLDNTNPEVVRKLMEKNEDNTYELEKYINNKMVVRKIIPLVNDVNKLIELCERRNDYELLEYANENILMAKNSNGVSILDFLVKEKNIIPEKLNNIPSNLDYIKFLLENNYYDYLKKANEHVQLFEITSGKTLLEILIVKGYNPEIRSIYEEKTIDILNKNNKLNLITDISDKILLKPVNELLEKNNYGSNQTFLEYMLDNGYNPLLNAFRINNDEILKILYKKQRYDLLSKISRDKIFNYVDGSKTFFECIIENIKEGKTKIKVDDLMPYRDSIDAIVKYYLTIAEHDMMEYISEVTEDNLLEKYGEKTLLERLLEVDSDLTLSKVIKEKVKSKTKIATILKSKGFIQQNADVSLKTDDFTSEYLNMVQARLGVGPFKNEGEYLLNKLEQLFLTDGQSDKGLVMALVSGYRQTLLINYEINIKELKKLIEVKEQNLDSFFYIKKEDSGYFSGLNGSVFCDNDVIATLLHETGHALHYYLTNNKIPENYQEVIDNARNNPEILKMTEMIADKYGELHQHILLLVEKKYISFFETYYSESKKEEIRDILKKTKEEKKQEYASLGIPEEQLDIILEEMFTEEEYIAHQKRIFIREHTDAIMRSEYGSLMGICDILDALYDGYLHSSNLKNQDGNKIKRTAGHGISYYFGTSHGFDEIVANFASISKSKDAVKMLELLKIAVGEEVYNMISNFYYQEIIGLKEELDTKKTMGGK